MQNLYTGAFYVLLFSTTCWGGVAVNPFLRPGSLSPVPKVEPPPPPPPKAINPSVAQEVEFRGYFLLKGIPHFCIFNKKANYGEWIKLTEKTYEEFEALAFDLQSEALTLAFNGQNFTLTLEQSKSSPGVTPSTPSLPKVNLPPGMPSSASPRVMPPKPKTSPQMPDWLVNRVSARPSSSMSYPRASGGSSSALSTQNRSIPTRFAPPSRSSSSVSRNLADNSISSSPINSRNISSTPNFSPSSNPAPARNAGINSSSSTVSNSSGNGASNSGNLSPSSSELMAGDQNQVEDSEIDLEDLPPPPPPPNILPPSPPPDIVPSLDE